MENFYQSDRRTSTRRENDREGIGREDLYLLMESYKNMIELNTTLLDRLESVGELLERILGDVLNLCSNQASIYDGIKKLPNEKQLGADLDKIREKAQDCCEELRKTIEGNRKVEASEHSKHTLRLYGAFGILGSLAIALVYLVIKIWPTATIATNIIGP